MITSCVALLEQTASRFPDKLAVVDNAKQYTFADMKEAALKVSAHIDREWQNKPVAVFLPKVADSLVAFMGILYSGNFYTPLDVKSPEPRLRKILNNLSPKAIVTSPKNAPAIAGLAEELGIPLIDIEDALEGEADFDNYRQRYSRIINSDPVYCIYTSGSTGDPKGVVIPHRSIEDMAIWAADTFSIDENTIIGNQAPFYFDLSTIDIFLMLKTGATLYLIPQHFFMFPVRLVEYLDSNKINTICWVPSALTNVLNHKSLDEAELKHLRNIFFIGEVMPTRTLNYWKKSVPHALFCNMYGPTETTFGSTYYIIDREFEDHEPLPIGRPCKNTDILILNDDEQAAATGEVGELCIRGTSLGLGYWGDREKTIKAFAQNPLSLHYPERIYRTGDLVRINEYGELMFCGRKDFQIKHSGRRIELNEIENAVSSIEECEIACVLYDSDNSKIVLFYVSKSDEADEAYIRKALSKLIPEYMIPSVYIKRTSIPLNANGKVDRPALGIEYKQLLQEAGGPQ